MSKNKNGGNGKERALVPEDSEWTPSLKGDSLETFRRVEKVLLRDGRAKLFENLKDGLKKAGKKGSESFLEKFIEDNPLFLGEIFRQEAKEIVDEATRAGSKGVEMVVQAGGESADVAEASSAASELVRHTSLLAANAGPDGSFLTASDRKQKDRKEQDENNKLRSVRTGDVRLFNGGAEKIYGKWTGISIKKLGEETGLMGMKAEATRRIKEIEDVDGTPMSLDDLRVRRLALMDLLREMSLKTDALLAAEKAPVVPQAKPEQIRGEAYHIGLRNGIEKRIDALENIVYLAPAKENFDEDAFRVYLKDTFAPFRSQGSKIADELSKLDREKDPAVRDEMQEKLIARATEWEKQAAEIQKFMETEPFNKLVAAPEKKIAGKERFKNSMAWLKDRGKDLTQKAKDLEIGKQIRVVGEKYNKIPRKYKYATSAMLLVGGLSAGAIGGSVGAAALGMIGVGRLGYRAVGATAAFVSIEAKLIARREKKEGRFNRHPKAVAAGVAALILLGAPASRLVMEHTGLGEEIHDAAEYIGKHMSEGLRWLYEHLPTRGGFAKGAIAEHPGLVPPSVVGAPSVIHSNDFEQSAWSDHTTGAPTHAPDVIHGDNFEQPEWNGGNGIVEVHQGDNLWNILKQQLHESGATDGMTEQQENYVIDSIEDKLRAASGDDLLKMGFSSENIDVIRAGEKLDLSGILGNKDAMRNILERAGHLGAATPPEGVAVADRAPGVIHKEDFESYSKWDSSQTLNHPVVETQIKAPTPRGSGHGFYGSGVQSGVKPGGFYGPEHPHTVNFGEKGPVEPIHRGRIGGFYGTDHPNTARFGRFASPENHIDANVHADVDVHSAAQSAVENVVADVATPKDPAAHLWEMRHPGETAPDSFLRKAQELRAHGVPLENSPLFAEEALSRMDSHLKEIFGTVGSKSGEWNAWKDYPAAEIIKMPRSSFTNLNVPKLQDYVRELAERTGLEPKVRGGRMESLEHFIVRAEAGSLNMDLGGGSEIDLKSAPGLYEGIDSEYVSKGTEAPTYFEQEPVPDMPPRYNSANSFRGNNYGSRFQGDQYPRYKPMPGGFRGNRWWNPFSWRR